jgi:hypothetical protein
MVVKQHRLRQTASPGLDSTYGRSLRPCYPIPKVRTKDAIEASISESYVEMEELLEAMNRFPSVSYLWLFIPNFQYAAFGVSLVVAFSFRTCSSWMRE